MSPHVIHYLAETGCICLNLVAKKGHTELQDMYWNPVFLVTMLKSIKASVTVDPSAVPKFHRHQSVLFALREKHYRLKLMKRS